VDGFSEEGNGSLHKEMEFFERLKTHRISRKVLNRKNEILNKGCMEYVARMGEIENSYTLIG
jgi:hypothetical protein